jgi:hypothetical protein
VICVSATRVKGQGKSPEKLEFSGDFTGVSGDFTALPENVPGEICLPGTDLILATASPLSPVAMYDDIGDRLGFNIPRDCLDTPSSQRRSGTCLYNMSSGIGN